MDVRRDAHGFAAATGTEAACPCKLKAELAALRAEVAAMECLGPYWDSGTQKVQRACGRCLPCRERARAPQEKAGE